MVTRNASPNLAKISAKSTIVHQKPWISVEVSFFVKFWKKFDLWYCEGKRFPPCVSIVWVGFTKLGTSCDVPDWVFGLYFRNFFLFDKIGESSTSWISRALECRPQKWLDKIAQPIIRKYRFLIYWPKRVEEHSQKKTNPQSPSARGTRFRGVLGCRK